MLCDEVGWLRMSTATDSNIGHSPVLRSPRLKAFQPKTTEFQSPQLYDFVTNYGSGAITSGFFDRFVLSCASGLNEKL